MLSLLRAVESGGKSWISVGVLAVLASYTFVYASLLVAAIVLSVALARRERAVWVPMFSAMLAAALTVVPLAVRLLGQQGQVGWLEIVNRKALSLAPTRIYFHSNSLAVYGFWALAIIGIVLLVLHFRTFPVFHALVLMWSVGFPVLFLVLGRFIPVYTPRYLSFCAPGMGLLFGACIGFVVGRWRMLLVALASLGLVMPLPGFFAAAKYQAIDDTARVAGIVQSWREPGDGLLYSSTGKKMGSSRIVCYAYPVSCVDSMDLTIETDVEHSPEIWESDQPLRKEKLDGLTRVISLLGPNEARPDTRDKRAILTESGFVEVRSEPAGQWKVTLWERKK